MPIAGYETYEHVLAQLAALEHELRCARNESHAEAVKGQMSVFQAEADRFEAEEAERLKAEHQARLAAFKRRSR
jgi:hypothetical protein